MTAFADKIAVIQQQLDSLRHLTASGADSGDGVLLERIAGLRQAVHELDVTEESPLAPHSTKPEQTPTARREIEAQYYGLMERSPNAVFTYRDGHFTFANTPGLRLMRAQSLDNLLRKPINELIHPDSREIVQMRLQQLHEGTSLDWIEGRFIRLDGTIVDVEVMAVVLPLLDGTLTQVIAHDITERKQADARIKHLNRLYAMLSQVNQSIVRVQDAETLYREVCRVAIEFGLFRMAWIGITDPDRGMVRVSSSAGVVDGYLDSVRISALDENIGRGPTGTAIREGRYDICDDIEHDPRMAPWRDAALKRGYRSSAAFPIFKRGQSIGALTLYAAEPHFFSAEIIRLFEEISGDVTFALESFDRESQRREAEERFALTFNLSPVPILINALDSEQYVDINRATTTYTGYRPAEMLGRTPHDLGIWADPELYKQFLHELREHGRVTDFEFQYVKKTGEIADALMSAELIELRQQKYVLKMFVDITRHKQAEAAIREQERLQVALDKEKELNELKTRFVTLVSHEFRTPLASIQLAGDLLNRYYTKMNESQRLVRLTTISIEIQRLAHLLDEVLTLSRMERGKLAFRPAPVELKSFCLDLLKTIQESARSHQLIFTSDGNSSPPSLDADLLQHILSNLLTNAVKYSPEGSNIYLDVQCQPDQVVFKVCDEGIGIPPEDQPRIFEAFHRASNVGAIQGTGLGLSIVRQMTERHGGTVIFDSTVDMGTTFTVTIPTHLSFEIFDEDFADS